MTVVPITRLEFQNKKVLVRCDFNVPIAEGKIQENQGWEKRKKKEN